MKRIYEVLVDHYTDKHDKNNGIIGSTDIVLETENEAEASEEYNYRRSGAGKLDEWYMWVLDDDEHNKEETRSVMKKADTRREALGNQ